MKDYPLIKFTLFFIAGILLQYYIKIDLSFLLFFFICLLVLSIVIYVIKNKELFQFIIIIPIVLLGSLTFSKATSVKSHYPFSIPKIKNAVLYGKLNKIELIRDKRLTFYLDVDSVKIRNRISKFPIKIMCNIYDSEKRIIEFYSSVRVGNSIYFKGIISRPKNARNPYEFDYEKYLSGHGVSTLATTYSTSDIKIIDTSFSWTRNVIFKVRNTLDNKITQLHNKTTRGLLRGLILADRSGIDYNTNTDFMNAGVVHVLSVSGLHVGYIVLIFLFLFSRFNLYWRSALTIIGLFLYMIITGSEAPVFRSTLMASAIIATPFLGRDTNGYNTLSFAALIILMLNPLELFNPSFQLSFSAILALIIFFPKVKKYVDAKNISNRYIKYFLMFLGSTLIAQIGTLPFTLAYFGRISLTSLLANFLVIPLSGIIVGLGIVSLILSMISSWAASIYASCNELLTYLLLYSVKVFGNPDYSFISIKQFTLYDSVLFYLTLGTLFGLWKHFIRPMAKVIFTLLLISTFLAASTFDNAELLAKNRLTIVAIDVGQGDAFLISFPNGKTALVDAGNATKHFDNGKRVILPLLEKLGIDIIDYAFISHIDSDHYMGILELIKQKKVGEVYKPSCDSQKQNDLDFENILKRNHIPIKYYFSSSLEIGNTKLYFLNNKANLFISSNDKSGVFRLVYGKNSFLFTGDAGKAIEKEYLSKYGTFLKSDVLKVAHHGSKSSSSWEFLSTITPKYVLISAGIMNKFHHPSNEVLGRLRKLHTKIIRTDELGACILSSDGNNIDLIDWRELTR